ncbi:AsmA family protein [Mucilaginibacter panaciglaebae]|uniref:AsmA domain-containing protein n=1 Tax=Mucilaginibacter panaciglaebae TaxID=502331 RepID=A0ABP7WE56_9SPHI
MPHWLKTTLKITVGLVLLLVLLIAGASLYITFRKDRFLKLVNAELYKSVDGTIQIGDMHPQFFKGFPNISLGLENVLIRDKRFAQHHHTLLAAKNFDVSVNTAKLFTGTIDVNHVDISNATIDLYTDSSGYSNISVFKTGPGKKDKSASGGSATQLKNFSLTNVNFKVDDQKAKKLFEFVVNDIHGKMGYPDSGWHAALHLDVTAKSMAFNTKNGSFVKGKDLEGDLNAGYNARNKQISVQADKLNIGDDPFRLKATFAAGKFNFFVSCDQLLWRNASSLLANNITLKLNRFNMSKPIAVTAIISGSFSGGDPNLYVTAKVIDNTITIPGSTLDNCSFDGIFTNEYVKGKGFTDENSVIKLIGMGGSYHHLPFRIDTGSIINLTQPIATGNFKSSFPMVSLNYLLGDKIAKFSAGRASLNLKYKADIVDYRINKPIVTGRIDVRNADIHYLSANLLLKNTSLSLIFVKDDLILSNIRLQTGRSVVLMNGRVNNFLNLYYNAPEKILLNWHIRSPQMYLGEFIGLLSSGSSRPTPVKSANSGDVIDQLSNVLQKGQAAMQLNVANLHYHNFLATDVHADLLTSPNGVAIKNVGLKTSGGALRLNGSIKKNGELNQLAINTTVSNVNIHDFFYAFDNFGMTDFTYQNLTGILSGKTTITAAIDRNANLVPRTVRGNLAIHLKDAALIDFKPLQGIGKYAFPFRDLKHIRIPVLDASFKVNGDQIEISPMQISSSVLNLDIAGTYGLSKGTNIAIDVPLRNPKGDSTITDHEQLQKKRFKGIVLHLLAKTDETGKVKIGLNKDRKKNETDNKTDDKKKNN